MQALLPEAKIKYHFCSDKVYVSDSELEHIDENYRSIIKKLVISLNNVRKSFFYWPCLFLSLIGIAQIITFQFCSYDNFFLFIFLLAIILCGFCMLLFFFVIRQSFFSKFSMVCWQFNVQLNPDYRVAHDFDESGSLGIKRWYLAVERRRFPLIRAPAPISKNGFLENMMRNNGIIVGCIQDNPYTFVVYQKDRQNGERETIYTFTDGSFNLDLLI